MIQQIVTLALGIFLGQLLLSLFTALVTYYEYKWYVKPQQDAAKADLLKLIQSAGAEREFEKDLSVN